MTGKKKTFSAGGDHFLRRTGNLRVRRERRWKRFTRRAGTLLMLASLAAATGFLVEPARSLVFESELFRVRRLIFQARNRAELEELTTLARPEVAGNLFRVDLSALERRIETHPWVRRARARRKLPDTVQVTLLERQPRALVRIDDRLQVIDSEGMTMDLPDGLRPDAYPLFVGLPGGKEEIRRDACRRGIHLLAEIRSRYPELAARIEKMNVGSRDGIDVFLTGHPASLKFPPEDGLGMLPYYLMIHDRIRSRVPTPTRIDLRWRGQISVSTADRRSIEG